MKTNHFFSSISLSLSHHHSLFFSLVKNVLLSKKKSLVLSEYYYERSTALSVCVSVCVSFRRGGASVDFDTKKAFSSFKGAEKNSLFRVSFSTLFF